MANSTFASGGFVVAGGVGATGPASTGQASPIATPKQHQRPSDPRFRSFAERYIITRSAMFRPGHEAEDSWNCLLDAKRIYAMVRRTGESILDSGLD